MSRPKPKPRGKYAKWLEPNNLIKLQGWARDGATNEMLAERMGIAPKTIYVWMDKYPEINDAIAEGKEIVDRKVENALYENALGYEWTEEQAIKIKEEYWVDGKKHTKESVELIEVRRKRPPDPSSTFFWLKNRKPGEWRDKQDLELSGEVNNPFKELTTEELREIAKRN